LACTAALAAYGNDGLRLNFGRRDFLGVGVVLGLALFTPLLFLAYLMGGSLLALVRNNDSTV